MKIQKVTGLIVSFAFASISMVPVASAAPDHIPPVVNHPVDSSKPQTHSVASEHADSTVAKTKSTSASAKKSAANNTVTQQKENSTATAERHLKPSPTAATNSVNNFFASRKIKSITGYQAINLAHDPNIKGQESAMIAALVVQANAGTGPKGVTFTEADLQQKFSDKTSKLYYSYVNALNKITQAKSLPANQELFGPEGVNANTRIYQGNAGDCFFLSAVNGILKIPGGPEQLKDMIHKVQGQTNEYRVTFPKVAEAKPVEPANMTPAQQVAYNKSLDNYLKAVAASKPVIVSLTDAEIGMYSHVEKGGKWLAILSVAEATRLHKLHFDPQATIGGGNPVQTLGLFTGKHYDAYNVPVAEPTAAEQQAIIDKINNAEKDSLPIAIETSDHVIAILGYKNGKVILKNPWGTAGWYDPQTGGWENQASKPGPGYYHMEDDGVFEVPIDQISRTASNFYDIIYHPESESVPATPASTLPVA